MTFMITINGKRSEDHIPDLQNARSAARRANDAEPTSVVGIVDRKTNTLKEVWVGPVTFMPTRNDAMIAYSDADLDSIGAIRKCGTLWDAGSRGTEVGQYLTLFDAAVGLHEFAKSPAYVSA